MAEGYGNGERRPINPRGLGEDFTTLLSSLQRMESIWIKPVPMCHLCHLQWWLCWVLMLPVVDDPRASGISLQETNAVHRTISVLHRYIIH